MYHLELWGVKEAQELKATLFLMYPSLVLDMMLTRLKVHFKKVNVVILKGKPHTVFFEKWPALFF